MLNEYGQPDYRINYKLRRDRAVNELLGLARGLIADGVVSDAEANELRLWARQNPDLCISFPGNELYHRLDAIYQDGRIDGDERQELLWFLEQFAGDGEPDESEGMGTTSLPYDAASSQDSSRRSRVCGYRPFCLRREARHNGAHSESRWECSSPRYAQYDLPIARLHVQPGLEAQLFRPKDRKGRRAPRTRLSNRYRVGGTLGGKSALTALRTLHR